jgi:hypothetical protein
MTEEAERRARDRDSETETTTAERLGRVDRRTSDLMARADQLDVEADRLLERVRDAAAAAIETLRDDADGLRAELDELPGESAPASSRSSGETRELEPADPVEGEGATAVVEPSVEAEPLDDEDEALPEPEVEPLGDEVVPEPRGGETLPEPPERTRAAQGGEGADRGSGDPSSRAGAGGEDPDTEGARLIALNMALSGSSREETAEYLRETFGLDDRALLDDVYDRVQTS